MNESKFTPGPWSLKSRNNPHEWDVVKFDTPSSDGPWFVAAVFDGAEGRASLDNARLIAAAPDLLEALEWIAGMAEVRAADDKQVFTRVNRGALRNIAARARAALSKAEGR